MRAASGTLGARAGEITGSGIGEVAIDKRAIFVTLCVAFIPYSVYVYTHGTEASNSAPMSGEARYGQQLFQKHNCIACHQFYGLGGYMGPDLTNVVSNRGSAYARAFLMSGTQRMPNFNLSASELDAMIAFLEFVDTTGRYPADEYQVNWFGTVVQDNE